MYVLVILRKHSNEHSFFGPFKTERKAFEYAEAWEQDMGETILINVYPLIVPYHSDVKAAC